MGGTGPGVAGGGVSAVAGSSSSGTGTPVAGSGGAPGASGGGASGGGAAGSGVAGAPGGAAGAASGGTGNGTSGAPSGGSSSEAGASGACPPDATFCSGFETEELPSGAVYAVNAAPGEWTRDFGVDTAQRHAGNSSLLVKNQSVSGSSGSAYRMLAVPAPSGAFWVRFWIRSDQPIGSMEHNVFAGASIGSTPNDSIIEIAEDVGLSFNTQDSVQWPTGYGRTQSGGTMPYTLPAMTWHCIEASFDGTNREQKLFVNNVQLIDAKAYPGSALAIKFFKFGFNSLHGPTRQMWFDDVAVAPSRIGGCPTVENSNQ